MKNLFLTLAFVFATSFSFAEINSNDLQPKENMSMACFDVTFLVV